MKSVMNMAEAKELETVARTLGFSNQKVQEIVRRRAGGESLAYLTGRRYFFEHEYIVRPGVLIPRFETEVLVFSALRELRQKNRPLKGIEIGVGSGAISVELLAALDGLIMVATDVSSVATETAQQNAISILGDSERLRIIKVENSAEVLAPVISSGPFDFLISNPPYLDRGDDISEEVIQNEPHEALFAPVSDPSFFYAEIAKDSRRVLTKDGIVFVEIPHERAQLIKGIFIHAGFAVKLIEDLTGRPRVLIAKLGVEGPIHG